MTLLIPTSPAALPMPWKYIVPGTGAMLAWIHQQGWESGTRIGFGGQSTPTSAAFLQAAWLRGCTVVLLQRRSHVEEIQRSLALVPTHACVIDGEHPLGTARPDAYTLPSFQHDQSFNVDHLRPYVPTAPALVVPTSGTTGTPRFARLSYRAIVAGAIASCQRLDITCRDRWLLCLPIDHVGGASIVVRSLISGCAIAYPRTGATEHISEACDSGATVISVVPTQLHRLINHRADTPWPASLRCILLGGSSASAELIQRSAALGLAPCQTYGLTEAGSQVCTLAPQQAALHMGTAGPVLDHMTIRIDDYRIIIRGDGLFDGYEEHGVVTTPHAPSTWFATGDCGTLDAQGFLTVHGRIDDMIMSGGENISPAEVEAALERHPGIVSAGVCGLSDPEWGQVVAAVLIAAHAPLADKDVEHHALTHLSRFKRPRCWIWASTLPTTASGKLQRRQLPTLFTDDIIRRPLG